MVTQATSTQLNALAQERRLALFRWLGRAGPDGAAAGQIAKALNTPANTLSAQLSILFDAGLVSRRREGRSIIYAANYEVFSDLIRFLVEDCCEGSREVCLAGLSEKSRQLAD